MTSALPISEILGYTSILCWLGAQFPQLLENIRNQSCEGLALPFLANWALGDLSNLIGCILTHQLPFQTWLAAYFCFVDLSLVAQYFYYGYIKRRPRAHPSWSSRGAPSSARHLPIDRGAPHYRTLSAVAANIAATAALAAQQDEQLDPRYVHARRGRRSTSRVYEGSASLTRQEDEDADEDTWRPLTQSFHSEGGRRRGRNILSWTGQIPARRGGSLNRNIDICTDTHYGSRSDIDPADLERGRPLMRDGANANGTRAEEDRQATSSRAGRRSATMVFLAVWALFSVGALVPESRSSTNVGRVLPREDTVVARYPMVLPNASVPPSATSIAIVVDAAAQLERAHKIKSTKKGPTRERFIGRISAWLCTTLYLTSRLPQIWKNFVRKSVEGLSMYLFIFAFLGNSFYVASILSSPQLSASAPHSIAFLRESLPYLLGSAGTLMFDVTIVSQSLIYTHKASHRHHRGRQRGTLTSSGHGMEEEASLLGRDALAASIESLSRSKYAASPTRTRS